MLTNADYLIIKTLKEKKFIYDEEENTMYVVLKDLNSYDIELLNRKSKYLKIQYVAL